MTEPRPRSLPILVVEDDPDDVLLIRRAFAKASLSNRLSFVTDGEDAVAHLTGQPPSELPSLILLDLKLPRMSGLELLQWRREQPPEIRSIPVVILTSSSESADVRRAYGLGANTYLVKPVEFDALLGMIRQLGLYWMLLAQLPGG